MSASFELTLDTAPPQPLFGTPAWSAVELRVPYEIDEPDIAEAYYGDLEMEIEAGELVLADPPAEDRLLTAVTRDEVLNEDEYTLLVNYPRFGSGTAGQPAPDGSSGQPTEGYGGHP